MIMRFLHAWLLASATAAVLVHSGVPTDPFSIVFVSIAAAAIAVPDGQHGKSHGHEGRDRSGGDTDEHDREWIGRHARMD